MKDKERSEAVVANRMQLIAPLLTERLDAVNNILILSHPNLQSEPVLS